MSMRVTREHRRRKVTVTHSRESRQRLNESYPAVAESVPAARRAIAEFAHAAGGREKRVQEIALAASEALTNVVLHAYPARPGRIHVTAELAGGELWVLIADSGCGLHAGRESGGLGLGLVLISEMSDGFSVVERSSGGTELRICFDLRAGNARADEPRGSARVPCPNRLVDLSDDRLVSGDPPV